MADLHIRLSDMEEWWDEVNETFVYNEKNVVDVYLEHSLYTISLWEEKYEKAFMKEENKSEEEMFEYVKMMIKNVEPTDELIRKIFSVPENQDKIKKYMEAPHSATRFYDRPNEGSEGSHKETVTAELIYYWMLSYRIPLEFEHWPLRRLMTLIEVFNRKNNPPKKRSQRQIMQDNAALNAARRAKHNTKG